MIIPAIVFVSFGAWAGTIVIRQMRLTAITIQQITKAYAAEGVAWNYWTNIALRIRIRLNPNAIMSIGDSLAVKGAKENYLKAQSEDRRVLKKAIFIGVAGFVAFPVVAVIETLLWKLK